VSNKIEEIKRAKDGLDVLDDIYRYAQLGFDAIPPDDYERMKWFGLFQRSQTPGFFMMRLRIPNGILTSRQTQQLGEIVNRFGRGMADITTRQNVQFRWLRIEDVPEIFALLKRVGVEHRQSGMDNVRNVTGCPMAGIHPDEVLDASSVAVAIQQAIVGLKGYSNLPRKFNISVSGCPEDCASSRIHDIGLTPARRDGALGFNVRVGGALGGKSPRLATDLDAFVLPQEAPALCTAILSIFRDHGPRENRQRARLKWLLEDWGMERFRSEVALLHGSLPRAGESLLSQQAGDHLGVRVQRQAGLVAAGLAVPVGRISGDDLLELARLSEEYGSGELRLTNDQNVLLVNIPKDKAARLLAEPLLTKFSAEPGNWLRRTVSCTGTDYCHFSLIDTKEWAVDIARSMETLLPLREPLRLNWSGCPHACGQHHIGDIGFQGARVRVGDEVVEAADIFLGGKLAEEPRLAEKVLDSVPLTELPARLAQLLSEHRLAGPEGPRSLGERVLGAA
jgi:ferredoxin-nitrite reductase